MTKASLLCYLLNTQLFTVVDNCASEPCENGGTCTSGVDGYTCKCPQGWSGDNCEVQEEEEKKETDHCASNPCRNGGTCSNEENRYKCKCRSGYRGFTCALDINECASNPCLNGGRCRNLEDSYSCRCTDGYTGDRCENAPERKEESASDDVCIPNPCKNEGTCLDMGDGDVFCFCQDGFDGDYCEEGENACIPNPCENGGTCIKWGESFTCTCAKGFNGDNCEKDIDECLSDPCDKHLFCVDQPNGYICREECEPGYTGLECKIEIDECESDPCQNGGTCTDETNSYKCDCLSGFKGINCETSDPCMSNPCQNGGDCERQEKGNTTFYRCLCLIGWDGLNCDAAVSKGCSGPNNGDGFVPFGASVEISCDDGYVLDGAKVVTCLESGKFDSEFPQCVVNGTNGSLTTSQTTLSPMVVSMIAAGGVVFVATTGFLVYVFVLAPWNAPLLMSNAVTAGATASGTGAATSTNFSQATVFTNANAQASGKTLKPP